MGTVAITTNGLNLAKLEHIRRSRLTCRAAGWTLFHPITVLYFINFCQHGWDQTSTKDVKWTEDECGCFGWSGSHSAPPPLSCQPECLMAVYIRIFGVSGYCLIWFVNTFHIPTRKRSVPVSMATEHHGSETPCEMNLTSDTYFFLS